MDDGSQGSGSPRSGGGSDVFFEEDADGSSPRSGPDGGETYWVSSGDEADQEPVGEGFSRTTALREFQV